MLFVGFWLAGTAGRTAKRGEWHEKCAIPPSPHLFLQSIIPGELLVVIYKSIIPKELLFKLYKNIIPWHLTSRLARASVRFADMGYGQRTRFGFAGR